MSRFFPTRSYLAFALFLLAIFSLAPSSAFDCDPSCHTCSGPSATQCLTCPQGSFLYWDNSCHSSCNFPLTVETTPKGPKCLHPCNDPSKYYLLNQTCSSICGAPFNPYPLTAGFTVCVFPCHNSFLNSKGTCQGTCKPPYTQKIQGVEKYCLEPPKKGSDHPSHKPEEKPENASEDGTCPEGFEFHYANDTCMSSCNEPFDAVIINSEVRCQFKCPESFYLSWENECTGSCRFPLKPVKKGVERYCEFGCDGSHFRYENNTCGQKCTHPFIPSYIDDEKFCNFACPEKSFLNWNYACQSTCNYPFVQKIKGTERYCELPCKKNEYLYEDGVCRDFCNFPFAPILGKKLNFCNFTCPEPSFMNWNNECQPACHPPFIKRIDGAIRYCEIPCKDPDFVYEDGSCKPTCEAPMIPFHRADFKSCESSCPEGLIHYWDGTCRPTCPSSFQRTIYKEELCDFHCSQDLFLYENHKCEKTCPFPYLATIDDENYKFCDLPCNFNEYLSQDGSCVRKCDKTAVKDSLGVNHCVTPCSNPEQFLYANGTCLETCSAPFKTSRLGKNILLCNSPCSSGLFYQEHTGSCISRCDAPLVPKKIGSLMICENLSVTLGPSSHDGDDVIEAPMSEISKISQNLEDSASQIARRISIATSYIRPSDPHSAFLMATAKTAKYSHYVNVPLVDSFESTSPSRLLTESSSPPQEEVFSISSIFSVKMPQALKAQIPTRPLPTKVFKGKLHHTSFLVNMWETMSTIIILFLLGVALTFIEKLLSKTQFKGLIAVAQRLKTIFKWNFMLLVLFNTYDDITFFTIIEFATLRLDSLMDLLSLLACIGVNILAGSFIYKVFTITKESLKARIPTTKQTRPFYQENESYQVLYAGFQDTSFLKQAFLLFYIGKIIISSALIATLSSYPLIQTVLLTVCSFAFLGYLLKERPMCDRFHVLVVGILEFFGLVINICLVILAFTCIDRDMSNISLQTELNAIILFCESALEVLSDIALWLYVFIAINSANKISKQSQSIWLNLLIVPFRTPGMELDEENEGSNMKTHQRRKFGWTTLEYKSPFKLVKTNSPKTPAQKSAHNKKVSQGNSVNKDFSKLGTDDSQLE